MHVSVPPIPKDERIPARHLEAALARDGAPTAARLAELLGVEESTVSRWRTQTAPLSRARWLAVLAVLGLPLDWKPARGAVAKPEKRGRGRPRGAKSKPRA
jgi:hypothetical protein